jgi:hypothetical protein
MDMVFWSAQGKSLADRSDKQFAKIQASVLAASIPLANLWSHMDSQGIKGSPGKVIPTQRRSRDSVCVTSQRKGTAELVPNCSAQTSTRRSQIGRIRIDAFNKAVSRWSPYRGKLRERVVFLSKWPIVGSRYDENKTVGPFEIPLSCEVLKPEPLPSGNSRMLLGADTPAQEGRGQRRPISFCKPHKHS